MKKSLREWATEKIPYPYCLGLGDRCILCRLEDRLTELGKPDSFTESEFTIIANDLLLCKLDGNEEGEEDEN